METEQGKQVFKDILWNVYVLSGVSEALSIHMVSLKGVLTREQKQAFTRADNALKSLLYTIKKSSPEDKKAVEENSDALGGDMLDLIYSEFRERFDNLEAIKKI